MDFLLFCHDKCAARVNGTVQFTFFLVILNITTVTNCDWLIVMLVPYIFLSLTHFSPMSHFYNSFSGECEKCEIWLKWVKVWKWTEETRPKCRNTSKMSENNQISGAIDFKLTHFSPVSHFYIPWKRQKTFAEAEIMVTVDDVMTFVPLIMLTSLAPSPIASVVTFSLRFTSSTTSAFGRKVFEIIALNIDVFCYKINDTFMRKYQFFSISY